MNGATPRISDLIPAARRSNSRGRALRGSLRAVGSQWKRIALASLMLPLSLALVDYGKAPGPEALPASAPVASDDSVERRVPTPQFHHRFPTTNETLRLKPPS